MENMTVNENIIKNINENINERSATLELSKEESDKYIAESIIRTDEKLKSHTAVELAVYDSKLDVKEVETGKSIYDIENPYERFLAYRNDNSLLGISFEGDVSIRTMYIFTKLFPYVRNEGREIELYKSLSSKNPLDHNKLKLKFEIGDAYRHDFVYRGDTMNSCAGTVNAYIRRYGKKLPDAALEFAALTHTIGNYTPIPYKKRGVEFNSPRGFNNLKINDYWDLTLLAIYNWFLEKNGKIPKYNLGLVDVVKNKESVQLVEKWLENFKDDKGKYSWDKFVSDNFMEEFVELVELAEGSNNGDNKEIFGMPMELWDGHFDSFEDYNRPSIEEEFTQFFTRVNEAIKTRGIRMCERLLAEI